jgi:outer membrane biosynthesis protein TonB
MKCISVLEKEIDICKMVIAYKKKNNLDSKEWENKIEQATKQLNDIKTKVESGEIDSETYKKTIQDEINYEQKLLDVYLAKDQASTQMQKDNIKKRINIRIIVLNNELKESTKNEGTEEDDTKEEKPQENTIQEEKPKNQEEVKTKPEPQPQPAPEAQDANDTDVKKAKYVDLLLQQYLSARNYFKENDLKENEKDCILKCKTIITAKRDIQLGNIDSVDLNSLPSQ